MLRHRVGVIYQTGMTEESSLKSRTRSSGLIGLSETSWMLLTKAGSCKSW